jgi:hypothetical protein
LKRIQIIASSWSVSTAMMNEPRLSQLDRDAILGGSDDGFPWFAGTMLAIESCEVVRLRFEKFARHEEGADREACLMVNEKIAAAFEATASWFAGAAPGAIIGRYREHVAANAKRLSPC